MSRFLRRATIIFVVCLVLALAFASHARSSHAVGGISGLSVSVAYAEDKHQSSLTPGAFPVPWAGSPNVLFLGNPVYGSLRCGTIPHCYDAGAIRLDNTTTSALPVDSVSVDDHSSIPGGKVFNLWGSFTVPAGQSVILTENPPNNNPSYDNFDTSGAPKGNCTPLTVAPTVTITVGGVPTTLVDSTHVLDTNGIDTESCSVQQNEAIQWRQIGASGIKSATLTLGPATTTLGTGQQVTETAALLDGGGVGLANATVNFSVTSGPNAGKSASAVTDNTGQASFAYTDTAPGTDSVVASITTAYTVGPFMSNQTSVLWANNFPPTPTPTPTGGPPTPTPTPVGGPVQLSNLSVADTANAAKWSLQTNLQVGALQYGDRSYTLATIPASLIGSTWIRSANTSKAYTGTPTVTFTINQSATVYVALDTRVTPKPSWLDATWKLTGLTLSNNEAAGSNAFVIYSKTFPAGQVALGPNDNGSTG
ncbi:MAG TPA: Ig-like domain-containing protein, partial [Ktedonobacteraceae bacterium]